MKRTNLERWICEVEKIDNLTRESLETLQIKKLNDLLLREKKRNGFYKNLPESVNSLNDLQNFPFTASEDLINNFPSMMLTSQADISKIITEETSGTTGEAKRLFYTERDLEHTIGFFSSGISEMVGSFDYFLKNTHDFIVPNEKVMIAMPYTGENSLGTLIQKAVERIGAIPVNTGIGLTFGELHRQIIEYKPTAYIGMPVPLLSLLRYIKSDNTIKKALISADFCPEIVKEQLETALGNKLYPHYGSREMCLGGAVTCPAHEGMHVRENHIIIEIIDEYGNVLPKGETGEIIITTLDMQAIPLIRYRTSDYGKILDEPCPCGGVTHRIDNIKRISEEKFDITCFDEKLFKIKEIIDYKITKKEDKFFIEALCESNSDIKKITNEIYNLTYEINPEIEVRACNANDKSLYLGKRTILH